MKEKAFNRLSLYGASFEKAKASRSPELDLKGIWLAVAGASFNMSKLLIIILERKPRNCPGAWEAIAVADIAAEPLRNPVSQFQDMDAAECKRSFAEPGWCGVAFK
ncbi:MAG: hypothetical protein AAGE61_03505 [Pseudomonadota bacterium]